MRRRIAALVRQELWQHGLVVLALLVLVAGVDALLLVGTLIAPRTMTLLETHGIFVRLLLPIAALALGNRLVVREYQQGTQRFLEALPVSRVEVVLTKLGLGFAVLSLAALSSLIVAGAAALARGEPLTLRWLSVVALKTELFVLALWSVLFTMGLLGRFRVPAYLAALVGLFVLDQATDVHLARFGPFALVGERFVLERESLAAGEALATLAIAFVALGLAFALSLAKEGAAAEALARRMSQREKAAVGAVLVFGLMAGEIVSELRSDEPFSFEREEVVRRDDPPLEVLYLEAPNRPAAEALADVLAADLAAMREALAIGAMPRVHVALRPTLGPRQVQHVRLEDGGSVLVRAAFTSEGFDRENLRASVLSRALERVTDGRAAFEPHAWVRSGFARAWAHREGESDRELRRRALVVARSRRPSFALLERSESTAERFGPAAAEALAYVAMRALEEEAGRERWLAFVRTVVGRAPPPGFAAVIQHRIHPVSARMRETTGVTPEALERALTERVLAWRRDPAMRGIPRARGHVAIEPAGGDLYGVRWRVAFDGAPEPGATCTLLHAAIGPFDAPVPIDELFREERSCAALAPEGELLVGRYGPGERVLAAIELDHPSLGAVRIASARLEVPR